MGVHDVTGLLCGMTAPLLRPLLLALLMATSWPGMPGMTSALPWEAWSIHIADALESCLLGAASLRVLGSCISQLSAVHGRCMTVQQLELKLYPACFYRCLCHLLPCACQQSSCDTVAFATQSDATVCQKLHRYVAAPATPGHCASPCRCDE